jgi:hypothetical protein
MSSRHDMTSNHLTYSFTQFMTCKNTMDSISPFDIIKKQHQLNVIIRYMTPEAINIFRTTHKWARDNVKQCVAKIHLYENPVIDVFSYDVMIRTLVVQERVRPDTLNALAKRFSVSEIVAVSHKIYSIHLPR